jgi:excisionase family DNA binding protein
MITFNSPYIFPESNKGMLINGHLTVQAAAEVTGYNMQYLRRLLRSGRLEGIKIGQMWLIDMESLETLLEHVQNTSDRRCGPR